MLFMLVRTPIYYIVIVWVIQEHCRMQGHFDNIPMCDRFVYGCNAEWIFVVVLECTWKYEMFDKTADKSKHQHLERG